MPENLTNTPGSRVILGVLFLCLLALPAKAEVDPWVLLRMDRAAFRARPIAMMPVDNLAGVTMVYGDRYAIVRVVRFTDRGAQTVWRSTALEGGAVQEVLVEDLDGRGGTDIIARTQGGQAYVFDENFTSRWSSVNEDFRRVNAMTLANLDADPAYEILMVADNQIVTYDGATFARESQFPQVFANVVEVLVGNVDTDQTQEIILNNGKVLDAATIDPEWETGPFGLHIDLFDIDGDGIDEIIGYGQPGQDTIRIFDADERQEKPFQ